MRGCSRSGPRLLILRWLRAITLTSAAAVLFMPAVFMPAVLAEPNFDAGTIYYQKKDFKKALSYFQQAARINPYSAEAVYYQALTYQQLGDRKAAVKMYATVVSRFGYSDAAKLASQALASLDPGLARHLSQQSATRMRPTPGHSSGTQNYSTSSYGSGGSSSDSLPAETRITFDTSEGGQLLGVAATVNGRQQKMFFDTGAEATVFGKNQLQQLGIRPPGGEPTSSSSGVGSNGRISTWTMTVDLKVGAIERKNFQVLVQENLSTYPLLGQTFFKDFKYTIHPTAHEIYFVRTGSGPSAYGSVDSYAVPFRRAGNDLVVTVNVNGRDVPMFFDTGASMCSFTPRQAAAAGITIPEDAQLFQVQGVGGVSTGRSFTIKRMKLGPIDKSDVQAGTAEQANMPYPLLGQTFFSEWQYTIDNTNSVIHFLRR